MLSIHLSPLLLLSVFLPAAKAQIRVRRRTSSIGRIIAGCVVGGVILIFFLCLLGLMMRKRRARSLYARRHPGAPIPGNLSSWNPVAVGTPFKRFSLGGQRNTYHSPQTQVGPQTSNYDNNPLSGPQPPMTNNNNNPGYPPSNDPLPPPAYGKDANYSGNYNPPPGPPPSSNQSDAPPIPPPAAYTGSVGNHTESNNFVGGFRA